MTHWWWHLSKSNQLQSGFQSITANCARWVKKANVWIPEGFPLSSPPATSGPSYKRRKGLIYYMVPEAPSRRMPMESKQSLNPPLWVVCFLRGIRHWNDFVSVFVWRETKNISYSMTLWGALSVMVITVGNGISDSSSNPGRRSWRFASR